MNGPSSTTPTPGRRRLWRYGTAPGRARRTVWLLLCASGRRAPLRARAASSSSARAGGRAATY